jgi:hypothetical protein
VGWWKRRSRAEFERATGAYTDPMTRETYIGKMCIGDGMFDDLPSRIEGRGEMSKNHIVGFLEREIPGIGNALYEWVEPASRGELIGEMLSSWPGAPRHADKEPDEEDT